MGGANLYAPLIIEDPADGKDYHPEAVAALDDWLDGVNGRDPDVELEQLRAKGMSGMNMGDMNHGGMTMGGSSMMTMRTDPNAPPGSDTGSSRFRCRMIRSTRGDSLRPRDPCRPRHRRIHSRRGDRFHFRDGAFPFPATEHVLGTAVVSEEPRS